MKEEEEVAVEAGEVRGVELEAILKMNGITNCPFTLPLFCTILHFKLLQQ